MEIRGNDTEVASTVDLVHTFLSGPSNLKKILPADKIENWSSTETGCAFQIKGLAYIELKLSENSLSKIVYSSVGQKPFPFQLVISLEPNGSNTIARVDLSADVNSFMAIMLQTPLTNFIGMLGTSLKKGFESA